MATKDDGHDKSVKDGGQPPQEQTDATHPAAPQQKTKPATKVNNPNVKGPPRKRANLPPSGRSGRGG